MNKESFLEKLLFSPGVSRCLVRCLQFQSWIKCRKLSKVFAKGLSNQFESIDVPFSFFVQNTTINFLKTTSISVYDQVNIKSRCWIIPENLYPSLQTLSITLKNSNGKSKAGHLVLPDSIRLRKLILVKCSTAVSNISFNPVELENIDIKGELSDGLLSSVFTTLCKAPKLRMINLEEVKCPPGSLEAVIQTINKTSTFPCQLQIKKVPLYKDDFSNCNLSHFILLQENKEWRTIKGRTNKIDLSQNPDLSIVHIQDPCIENLQLFTKNEYLENLTTLMLVCNAKMITSLISSCFCVYSNNNNNNSNNNNNNNNNWLSTHLPNLQNMELIGSFNDLLDCQLFIQNHHNLNNLKIKLSISSIKIENMKALLNLEVGKSSNIHIQNVPSLQRLELLTTESKGSLLVNQVTGSLKEFVWHNLGFSNGLISSLQIPWQQLDIIHVYPINSEAKISNMSDSSLSLNSFLISLPMFVCLKTLILNMSIIDDNNVLTDRLMKASSQICTLQHLELHSFRAQQLSVISGFVSLTKLEIYNSLIYKGIIHIENIPSLKWCTINYLENAAKHTTKYAIWIKNLVDLEHISISCDQYNMYVDVHLEQLPRLSNFMFPDHNDLSSRFGLFTDLSPLCLKQIQFYQNLIDAYKNHSKRQQDNVSDEEDEDYEDEDYEDEDYEDEDYENEDYEDDDDDDDENDNEDDDDDEDKDYEDDDDDDENDNEDDNDDEEEENDNDDDDNDEQEERFRSDGDNYEPDWRSDEDDDKSPSSSYH